ncbi:hypothetical protein [Runella sp.]|jgi:hypothetical protein|uniref:hypothetical protein n=1 Tax=Runella sp. TaxID=1960881 RepID=UPI0026143608|nr:hypothetical protein [Runella sp.]
MEILHVVHYSGYSTPTGLNDFEEALGYSMRCYSMRHLLLTGTMSQEDFAEALQKSMQVCAFAGIDTKAHFKKIYVSDSKTGAIYSDWLMSKKGFNLMIMQCQSLNEQIAHWLWKLAD